MKNSTTMKDPHARHHNESYNLASGACYHGHATFPVLLLSLPTFYRISTEQEAYGATTSELHTQGKQEK